MKEGDQSVILLGVGGGVRQVCAVEDNVLVCKENTWTIHTQHMNTTVKDDTVTMGQ